MNITEKKPSPQEWMKLQVCLPLSNQFLGLPWFESWAKNFLPFGSWTGPLKYLTISDANECIVGVFPLAFQKKRFIQFASLGGYYQPFRGVPISLGAEKRAYGELVKYLRKLKGNFALRIGPVSESDPVVRNLIAALEQEKWTIRKLDVGSNYLIHLPSHWDEYLEKLGKNLRFNMNYYERKMKKDGKFEVCHMTSLLNHDWRKILDDLEFIEQHSWLKNEGGDFRFSGKKNKEFWFDVVTSKDTLCVVNVWMLNFNGQPGSFCFALDCGAIRYILANNFDENLKNYSTGTILYKHVFFDAINKHIETVNIGLGNSGYKSRWGARQGEHLVDLFASPPGVKGKVGSLLLWVWSKL